MALSHLLKKIVYLFHFLFIRIINRQLSPKQLVDLLTAQHLVVVQCLHHPFLALSIVKTLFQGVFYLFVSRLGNLLRYIKMWFAALDQTFFSQSLYRVVICHLSYNFLS